MYVLFAWAGSCVQYALRVTNEKVKAPVASVWAVATTDQVFSGSTGFPT
jgi:hypothetical protein